MKTPNNKQGFTIIEVVLVLAIAGLIFLMVFVALPALQRSQRDTQRRNDMARVATALINYQTNQGNSSTKLPGASSCTGNSVPTNPSSYSGDNAACKFIATYMNASGATSNDFRDPDGTLYNLDISDSSTALSVSNVDHKVYIRTGKKCGSTEGTLTDANGSTGFAVLYKLEGAGTYCADNE